MSWIRLEATSGLRIMSPSFAPPPRLEGIDKLFNHPIQARSFHCFRSRYITRDNDNKSNKKNSIPDKIINKNTSSDGIHFTEEVLVLVQKQQVGGKLGEVAIAVGSTISSRDELTVLLDSAFEVVLRTNNNGIRLIFDALCASSFSSLTPKTRNNNIMSEEVIEYDGLPTSTIIESNGERRINDWHITDEINLNNNNCKNNSNLCYSAFSRRKSMLYFVNQDIVPISLLYSQVVSTNPIKCSSSLSNIINDEGKEIQSLSISATRACSCILNVIDRTLIAAFEVKDDSNKQIWGNNTDKLPFITIFSTSGLLSASPSFFRLTDHYDRLIISAVAIDQLCRWPYTQKSSSTTSLLHIHELLWKCRNNGPVLRIVFISVGSAITCVCGFLAASDENLWSATTLLKFLDKFLLTSRLMISLGTVDKNNKEEVEEKEKEENNNIVVEEFNNNENIKENIGVEFGPHMVLCAAPIHPTPWFNHLLHEINKIETDIPRSVLIGINEVFNIPTSRELPNNCGCLSFFPWHKTKKNSKKKSSNSFLWYNDVKDLSLDLAWCVAASHIVIAEASACRSGFELGHHSLFSLISGVAEENEIKELRRYGVGWFQHCWRNTPYMGNNNGNNCIMKGGINNSNSHCCCSFCAIPQADPTKLLSGFSSIGGGPRASVHYELKERKGGCFFNRKPKIEACNNDNTPVFTLQTTIFPYSLLFEEDGANIIVMNDKVDGMRYLTAFYSLSYKKMKSANRDALLQQMIIMEGDQLHQENDVAIQLLQEQRNRSIPSVKAFSNCQHAANCVLEDVWRHANS